MPCLFVTNIVDVLMYNYMLFFRGKINERHPANDGFQREQYGRHIGNLIYDAAYCFQIVAMCPPPTVISWSITPINYSYKAS